MYFVDLMGAMEEKCQTVISIIIPVYNVEKYLCRCVDSVLVQTFTDFEVLLIDDGSTDNSGKICDEYARQDNRVKVFHKENGGVSSARNLGLDNATGQWVLFVDSDDWISADLCQDILYMLEVNKADMVCWNYFIDTEVSSKPYSIINDELHIVKGEENIVNLIRAVVDSRYWIYMNKFCCDLTPIWNKVYRMDVLRACKIRFNDNMSRAEDVLFNILYLKNISCVLFTNRCFTHYYIRSSSITHASDWNSLSQLPYSLNAILDHIDKEDPIVLQCFLLRCIRYVREYCFSYFCIKSISYISFREKICEITKIIGLLPSLRVSGLFFTIKMRLYLYLMVHKYFRCLLLIFAIRNYTGKLSVFWNRIFKHSN